MNDRFVSMTSYNEMRNDFTFLRVGIAKKFGQTCNMKSCFQQSEKHFQQIQRHGLMKGFGSQSLLIALGLSVKKVNASTNMNVCHFTNIR